MILSKGYINLSQPSRENAYVILSKGYRVERSSHSSKCVHLGVHAKKRTVPSAAARARCTLACMVAAMTPKLPRGRERRFSRSWFKGLCADHDHESFFEWFSGFRPPIGQKFPAGGLSSGLPGGHTALGAVAPPARGRATCRHVTPSGCSRARHRSSCLAFHGR